jgi:MFS transporter, UMF1 family
VVGLISDVTGNIRNAFFFLAAMMWISLPLLSRVDVLRGHDDAKQYVAEQAGGSNDYVAVPYSDAEDI